MLSGFDKTSSGQNMVSEVTLLAGNYFKYINANGQRKNPIIETISRILIDLPTYKVLKDAIKTFQKTRRGIEGRIEKEFLNSVDFIIKLPYDDIYFQDWSRAPKEGENKDPEINTSLWMRSKKIFVEDIVERKKIVIDSAPKEESLFDKKEEEE
jgi:hypothetical protein